MWKIESTRNAYVEIREYDISIAMVGFLGKNTPKRFFQIIFKKGGFDFRAQGHPLAPPAFWQGSVVLWSDSSEFVETEYPLDHSD